MKTSSLTSRAAVACLCLAASCVAVSAGDDGSTPQRKWSSARQASEGPILDAAWFENRKAIVYLIPEGGLMTARRTANVVMRDLWTAEDWDTKHVFVGGVPSPLKFAIGKHAGLQDAVRELTKAYGQGEEAHEQNEALVRKHVFFVHDAKSTLWDELLGPDPADAEQVSTETADELPVTVVVLDAGRVVGSIDVTQGNDDAHSAPDHISAEVRRLLSGTAESGQ